MDVVLNSHIALLVLGYLYDEKLDNVSKFFCKYSPHLDEEYQIIKKGLRPIIINSENLSTIVREHCYIKSKVNEIVSAFPKNINAAFDRQTLSGKINHLLKILKKTMNIPEEKINLKRSRKEASFSSEKDSSTDTTQAEDLPGYSPLKKKRRKADSYMFVGNDFSEDSESEEEDLDGTNIEASIVVDKVLENRTLQKKLLQNINKALKKKDQNEKKTANNLTQTTSDANIEQMIQNIIAVTEKDPSFEEVISNAISTNIAEHSQRSLIQKNQIANKSAPLEGTQSNITIENNTEQIKLNSTQPDIFSQFTYFETPNPKLIANNCNSNYIKTRAESEQYPTETTIPETNTNISGSKIFFMNPPEFVSSFSPFKTDQILLDLNGGSTYPILMGNDGSVYINMNEKIPNETRSINNLSITNFNSKQKNCENNSTQTLIENPVSIININENINSENNAIISPTHVSTNNNLIKTLSLECSMANENLTPECNISATNVTLNKSLSTPRRKSSHDLQKIEMGFEKHIEKSKSDTEKNEINVIDPTVNSVIENESSNSTDLTGEQSNVTVIHSKILTNEDTPRRKTTLESCKRKISNTENEVASVEKIEEKNDSQIKHNNSKISQIKADIHNMEYTESGTDLMEEWKEMRKKSTSPNFDHFIREIQSKTPSADDHIQKRRKLRRKIGSKLKSDLGNTSKKCSEPVGKIVITESKKNETDLKHESKAKVNRRGKKSLENKKTKNVEPKANYLNFRIKTPIKGNSDEIKPHGNKRSCKTKTNNEYKVVKQPISTETSIDLSEQSDKNISQNNNDNLETFGSTVEEKSIINNNLQAQPSKLLSVEAHDKKLNNTNEENYNFQKLNKEREKRTANIAHILDTPFKLDDISLIPITPGIALTNDLLINNTPMTKLSFSSYCNLRSDDIKTPIFAITPGGHLNYSTEKETPRSGIITDYSSGGSYYRPDDSADIKKRLDKQLNEKFEQRQQKIDNISQETISQLNSANNNLKSNDLIEDLQLVTNVQSSLQNTIVTEIIPCPVVLEKVKSFSEDIVNVVPHYKLMEAGLPDISDESTCSSSTDSSSSSSNSEQNMGTKPSPVKKVKKALSVLSNIESSEDDDWEVQSNSKKLLMEENSLLVSNDGEVRFPVRSWITPKKGTTICTTLNSNVEIETHKQNVPDTPSENIQSLKTKKCDRNYDLKEKLERVKAKLNVDLQQKVPATNKTKVKGPSKYNLKTKSSSKQIQPSEKVSNKSVNDNQLDILAALNLSAKKTDVGNKIIENMETEVIKEKNIATEIDDNATSEIFTLKIEESESNDSLEVRNAALTLTKMRTRRMDNLNINPIKSKCGDSKSLNQIQNNKSKSIKCKKEKIVSGRAGKPQTLICDKPKKNEKAKKDKCNTDKIKSNESKKCLPLQAVVDETHSENNISKITDNSNHQTLSSFLLEKEIEKTNLITNVNNNALIPSVLIKIVDSKTNDRSDNINQSREEKLNLKNANKYLTDEKNSPSKKSNCDPDSDCEDPYDECDFCYAENNEKNIKFISYDGNDTNLPKIIKEKVDLSKLTMKITINGDMRKIECSEQFNLFSLNPDVSKCQSIKEGKNKKKVKSDKLKQEKKSKPNIPSNKKQIIIKKIVDNTLVSSTPLLRKIRISHRNKFNSESAISKKIKTHKNVQEHLPKESSSQIEQPGIKYESESGLVAVSNQESLSKQNIRNEDINAVLSHLYGNGK